MIEANRPTRGYYEVEDLPFGAAYIWRTVSKEEEEEMLANRLEERPRDEVLHPWRYRPEPAQEDQLPY